MQLNYTQADNIFQTKLFAVKILLCICMSCKQISIPHLSSTKNMIAIAIAISLLYIANY